MANSSFAEMERQGFSPDLLRAMYVSMLRIRIFEERVADLLEAREITTATHLYIGQEAVAVGVCSALRQDDYIWGNHRSHGHYLAKGGDIKALMAELYCKATGCSRGRGGSMHLFAGQVGLFGTVPMVAATVPIAVGAALSAVTRGSDQVSVAFFGDGATEEGVFHESLNFAALKKLPVVFVCENNYYSSHLPLHKRRPVDTLIQQGAPYGIHSVSVDGNDVLAVLATSREAVTRGRAGQGPTFIECRTYRWRGHVGPKWDLELGIRDQAELEAWMVKCPTKILSANLIQDGICTVSELAELEAVVRAEVEDSVAFARESPYPPGEQMPCHVYAGEE